jgi:hypothetical protein
MPRSQSSDVFADFIPPQIEDKHLLGQVVRKHEVGLIFYDVERWAFKSTEPTRRVYIRQEAIEGVEVANIFRIRISAGLASMRRWTVVANCTWGTGVLLYSSLE